MCDMRMPVVLMAIALQTAPSIGLWHVFMMGCKVTGHPSFVKEGNLIEDILMTGQSC